MTGRTVELEIPDPALVLLVGLAGCGKSSFADRHFRPTEVLSSDAFRAMVADDPTDQSATSDAFAVLRHVLRRRLARGLMAVVDATNLERRARRPYLARAAEHGVAAVGIVLDVGFEVCLDRDTQRDERRVGEEVLRRQQRDLERTRRQLPDEGYAVVHILNDPETVEVVEITRVRRRTASAQGLDGGGATPEQPRAPRS
jgi:protein phosphatase